MKGMVEIPASTLVELAQGWKETLVKILISAR